MSNGYLKRKAIESKATRNGMLTMSLILLLAADNVLKDHFDETEMPNILKELEEEVNQIWNEVMDSVPNGDSRDMAELVIGHVDDIRNKYGMKKLRED